MATINKHVAKRVAKQLRIDGFDVTAEQVLTFVQYGSAEESVVGPEYDAALESAILQQLDEYGIEV
jgi:hypothetical protein